MSGAERPNLTETQLRTLNLLKETEQQIEASGESYCVQIVGLSGIGKSTIVQELSSRFPNQDIDRQAEDFTFSITGIPLRIKLSTLTGEIFDTQGKIVVSNDNEETLTVAQRTLSIEEVRTVLETTENKNRVEPDIINTYTLGVPKLIQIVTERDYPFYRLLQITGDYLASHLQGLPDSVVPAALATIEEHFLAQGRYIPSEIKDHVFASRYKHSALGEVLHRLSFESSRTDGNSKENAQFALNAVKRMHPESLAFYTESLGSEGHGVTYQLEAWLDIPEVQPPTMWDVMDMKIPMDEYGTLGKFMKLFNLRPSVVGVEGRSGMGIAGEYNKCKFTFRVGNDQEGTHIGNNRDKHILELLGGNTRDYYATEEQYERRRRRKSENGEALPNYFVEAWDHSEYGQAHQMLTQEAALQALGVKYRVMRSDGKTYVYEPGNPPKFNETKKVKAWDLFDDED